MTKRFYIAKYRADKQGILTNNGKKEIANYNAEPVLLHLAGNRHIADFTTCGIDKNIDMKVVKSFGEELNKFHNFFTKLLI